MNRRQVIGGLGASSTSLLLAACGGESATIRFRVIATAEVDGERVEGSSVMEITWKFDGYRSSAQFWSEAVILDLKNRGTAYILPVIMAKNGSGVFLSAYDHQMLKFALAKNTSPGVLTPEDYKHLRGFRGRKNYADFAFDPKHFPLMVSFKNEREPNSVFEVNPHDFTASFGPSVRFLGLGMETTTASLTKELRKRLTFLDPDRRASGFSTDPPGQGRSMKDTPLNFKLGYNQFIKEGLF
jgi:hypothetical protein